MEPVLDFQAEKLDLFVSELEKVVVFVVLEEQKILGQLVPI